MPNNQGNLHDSMFRAWFAAPEAAGLLFAEQLPERLFALFKPGSPELIPGSFIDDQLAEHRTDLLYRVQLKQGGDAYIYALVEHKSSADPLTPLQLLGYKHKIWTRPPEGKARLPLAPIIPLVFYHGARPWSAASTFHGMFAGLDAEMAPLTEQSRYVLIDLGRIDDDKLSSDLRQRAYLAALKYNTRPDMREVGLRRVARLFASLTEVEIRTVLRYILCQHEDITGRDLNRVLLEYEPQRKDRIMHPLFQEHFDRGRTKGMAAGEAKGRAEGKAEGKAETLLRLLAHRFGALPENVEQRICGADAETLDLWALRVLDARSLADVFDN